MNNRIIISEHERNSIRKMQLLEQVSPNSEIIDTMKDMGFEKQNCKNSNKTNSLSLELSFEYCNKSKPQIVISYPKPYTSLEVLDLINQKIIEILDSPTPLELESVIKGYFANNE